MRVLQVHTRYRQGGGEDAAVAADAAALRAAGHHVTLADAANPEGAAAAAGALLQAPWRLRAARGTRRAIAVAAPDVVHLHNTWFALSPAVAAAAGSAHPRPAVVLTLHNYRLACPAGTLWTAGGRCRDCLADGPLAAVRHRCYRDSGSQSAVAAATAVAWRRSGALDAVDRLLSPSAFVRDVLVQAGLPGERIAVRPHGSPDPGPRPTPPSAARDLLFVGRAVAEKGLDHLLRWWGDRQADGAVDRSLRLRVLGEGPVADAWRDRLPPRAVLEGAVPPDRVRDAMRGARALLVPSLWDEPFGLVAVEAMAAGLPVASTGLGGLAEVHGDAAGWLTASPAIRRDGGDAWDEAAWDRVLAEVADDAEVDRRGAAGRQRYAARHTPDRALAGLLDVYDAARDAAARR